MKGWITGLCCVLALFLFFSCGSEKKAEETAVDLPQIQERKELVVLTVNSSVSYFHYRGEPMGFQYELAQQFAKSLEGEGCERRRATGQQSAQRRR